MSNHSISADLVFSLCQSQTQFPIDFEDAWQWIGYFNKPTAKRALLSCGFVEEIDLSIDAALSTASNPRPKECIMLTVDCLKMWAMMAGTEKGKEVRLYFLKCERQLKQLTVKPRSLLDLSPAQLYQLAAHQLSIEFGKKPDPKLIEGLDREYLQATGDAVFYAYHSISCKIATGTKLANDALREIGWLEVDEKEKKKEDKDIVEFAKHLKWLDDRFAGSRDFHQFESHQLALAAGN
jgi:phage anti-repressor protein